MTLEKSSREQELDQENEHKGEGMPNGYGGRPAKSTYEGYIVGLEDHVEELEQALRAYDQLFRAWEGKDSLVLNEEAIRQWRSIAQDVLV